MKTDKQLAETMRASLDRKALQKKYTFGLYSVECEGLNKEKWYAPPFVARDDESALMALIEVSKSHPEMQRKMVYCLGSYCAINGKLVSNKPRLVALSPRVIECRDDGGSTVAVATLSPSKDELIDKVEDKDEKEVPNAV